MHFLVIKKSSVVAVLVAVLLVVALVLSFSFTSAQVVYFGGSLRKIPIYRVATDEKKVALTFDAAWGADKTERICNILKENGADATFFLVGFWMENFPDQTKMISDMGYEIGSHSNTHPHMSRLSKEDIINELSVTNNKITELCGIRPKVFRAPFGEYNDTLIQAAESLDLKTIQWDVDSLDWKGISSNEITERVLSRVKNGSIILFHNNSDHILEALPAIILSLKNEGYSFVRVSDLVLWENYIINNSGEQVRS